MHAAALHAAGLQEWSYQRLPVPPGLFAETVRALPRAGFRGANVTIPHKEAALALCDEVSEGTREIGAVNTLTFEPDGRIRGDNTDAPGFLLAVDDPLPKTALVLGAGGSARAVAWVLDEAGVDVAIYARTRREGLRGRFVDEPVAAELLVNCTPVGLHDDAVPLDPRGYPFVADLVYKEGGTELLRRAEGRTVDGLE